MVLTPERLRKNWEFDNVYRNGRSLANKYLVMYVVANERKRNRYGISVSKKVGNSVVRHRVKRLIRESARLHDEEFEQGYDVVVIARVAAKEKTYAEIEGAFLHLGRIHGKKISNRNNKSI